MANSQPRLNSKLNFNRSKIFPSLGEINSEPQSQIFTQSRKAREKPFTVAQNQRVVKQNVAPGLSTLMEDELRMFRLRQKQKRNNLGSISIPANYKAKNKFRE